MLNSNFTVDVHAADIDGVVSASEKIHVHYTLANTRAYVLKRSIFQTPAISRSPGDSPEFYRDWR